MASEKNQPRDEGVILAWPVDPEKPLKGDLDPQQYEAARGAHRLFLAMAEQADEKALQRSELDGFLPRLDAHRRNHTVLIESSR
jgi:hypothetical protein